MQNAVIVSGFRKWSILSIFCCLVVVNSYAFIPPVNMDKDVKKKGRIVETNKSKNGTVNSKSPIRKVIFRGVHVPRIHITNTVVRINSNDINTKPNYPSIPRCHMSFGQMFPGRRIRLSNYAPIMYDSNGQKIKSGDWPPITP